MILNSLIRPACLNTATKFDRSGVKFGKETQTNSVDVSKDDISPEEKIRQFKEFIKKYGIEFSFDNAPANLSHKYKYEGKLTRNGEAVWFVDPDRKPWTAGCSPAEVHGGTEEEMLLKMIDRVKGQQLGVIDCPIKLITGAKFELSKQ